MLTSFLWVSTSYAPLGYTLITADFNFRKSITIILWSECLFCWLLNQLLKIIAFGPVQTKVSTQRQFLYNGRSNSLLKRLKSCQSCTQGSRKDLGSIQQLPWNELNMFFHLSLCGCNLIKLMRHVNDLLERLG